MASYILSVRLLLPRFRKANWLKLAMFSAVLSLKLCVHIASVIYTAVSMYSCVSIWMNPQTLSQNYKSGVEDEFDLTGTNSKRDRESRWVQQLKQIGILPLRPLKVLTLSGLDIWKSYPFKVSGIRQCFWKKKKNPRSELKLRSCIPRRALSYTNSDGILSLSIFFIRKIQSAQYLEVIKRWESVPSNPIGKRLWQPLIWCVVYTKYHSTDIRSVSSQQ